MKDIKQQLASSLQKVIKDLTDLDIEVQLEQPSNKDFGDYSTNIAMFVSSKFKVQS